MNAPSNGREADAIKIDPMEIDLRDPTCPNHAPAIATDRCSDCGVMFCTRCIVPPIKEHMPVRCVDCAMVAAGVRTKRRTASRR